MTRPLIAYTRVSRKGDREDGKFHSPEQQRSRATKYATDHGYEVVPDLYEDIDVSGGTHPLDRPRMAQAIREIEAGRAGGIVAYDMSRLSREPSHLEWLARKMEEHDAVLLWPGMPVDPKSAIGELQIGVLAQFDRYTRKQATERFALAKEGAIRRGINVAGSLPLGYMRDEARRMVLDPAQAPIVRELFERRIAGESDTSLARFLRERTGRAYARQSIAYIVSNPIYHVGRLVDGATVSEFEAGAIVDEATFQAAQRVRHIQDQRTAKSKGSWLLTGLVKCAYCGRRLRPWNPAKREGKRVAARPRYRCAYDNCPHRPYTSISMDLLDEMVTEQAFADCVALMEHTPDATELAPLAEALEIARRRFEQMQTPEAMDALGEAWAVTAKARRTEMEAAAAALGEARAAAGLGGNGGRVLNLGWIWDDLSPEAQRQALQEVYAEVIVANPPEGANRREVQLPSGNRRVYDEPGLTFVPREPHAWRPLEMTAAEISQQ